MTKALLIVAITLSAVTLTAQEPATPQTPAAPTTTAPVIEAPGRAVEATPGQPSQPAVPTQEVSSPAAPTHYTDQAIWALMVSFVLQWVKKNKWFSFLSEESTARLKAQFGFATAVLTAAGIHFAVTGSVLDGGGAAITISGLSLDAIKDIGWQWASQQAWYKLIVKE